MSPQDSTQPAKQDLSSPPPQPPASEPGGGLTLARWLQILSTFIVFLNTWGLLLTFGVFQTHYETVLLQGSSSSGISWISTTSAFVTLSAGLVVGPLYDRGQYRTLLVVGTHTQVFGLMILSLSTAYYQLFFSQAICVGLGAGIAFTPSVAAAASSLTNPAIRAMAMGAMACGSSIGGIIYPVMFRFLVPKVGFPWTVRAIAFVVWGLYLVSFVVLANKHPKPSILRPWIDTKALIDVPFMLMCVASVCSATAYYIPSLYLPLVSIRKISWGRPGFGLDLLTILNGASIVGRLLAGFAGAMFGPTETIAVCLVFGSIILFCWSVVTDIPGTIAWSVFWGMTSGVLVALPGAFIPLFCPSVGIIGTRSGMYWVFVGLGMLIGSPVGGEIYGGTQGEGVWQLPVFAGIFMVAAAALTLYPIVHLRKMNKA